MKRRKIKRKSKRRTTYAQQFFTKQEVVAILRDSLSSLSKRHKR